MADDAALARERLRLCESQDRAMYDDVVRKDVYRATEQELSGRRVLDAGANIGMFSLLALSKGARSVVAVEPNPQTFARLLENVRGLPVTALALAVLGHGQPAGRLSGFSEACSVVPGAGEVEGRTLGSLLSLFPGGDDDLEDLRVELLGRTPRAQVLPAERGLDVGDAAGESFLAEGRGRGEDGLPGPE